MSKRTPILLSPACHRTTTRTIFLFRHAALANVLKSNVALIIAKTAALRVNLNACRYAYLTESVPIYMLLAVNFNVDDCQLPSRRGVRLSFSSCHMAKRRVGV